jgi:hypothetical protein
VELNTYNPCSPFCARMATNQSDTTCIQQVLAQTQVFGGSSYESAKCKKSIGGAGRNRTGDGGFADLKALPCNQQLTATA